MKSHKTFLKFQLMLGSLAFALASSAGGTDEGGYPLSGFADVRAFNTVGVTKVAPNAGETIVAVPWVRCSTNSLDATLASLVPHLTNSAAAYAYSRASGDYASWHRAANAWVSDKRSIVKKGEITAEASDSPAASDFECERLSAVIVRGAGSGCIYLAGQAVTNAASAQSLASGSSLVAPPAEGEVSINDDFVWSGVPAGALLTVIDGTDEVTLNWDSSSGSWYETKPATGWGGSSSKDTGRKLDLGHAFWYYAGSAGASVRLKADNVITLKPGKFRDSQPWSEE